MRTSLFLSVVVALALLLAAGPAHAAGGLVITPAAGAKRTATPVRVVVRAPYATRDLRITINGRDVTAAFGAADRRGRRALRASASHGLRFGRNVVRVHRRVGGRLRRGSATFTITRDRPLVGAGADRSVVLGTATRLNGRASRARRAPKPGAAGARAAAGQAGTPAGLQMRWRLLRRPGGSTATLQGLVPPSLVQPLDGLLTPSVNVADQPARPLLVPDRPGRYVAALTVSDGGATSLVDTVTLTATLATPLVPVDTAATVQGQPGVAVGYHPAQQGGRAPDAGAGERFFPLGAGNALQVVVLDRSTLETVATQAWPITGLDQAATWVAQYDDADLVLMTAWENPAWKELLLPSLPLTAAKGAAGLIGAQAVTGSEALAAKPLADGQMTFIGVPGFPQGEAWEIWGRPQDQAPATLDGFLAPDSNDNYAYLGASPRGIDLGPDGQSVSLKLGESTYTASLPAGQGGFTAVYVDAKTLRPSTAVPSGFATQATYQTTNADGSPNLGEMQRMTSDLQTAQKVLPELLIAVRSIGPVPLARMGLQPPSYAGPFDQAQANALNGLVAAVTGVGGEGQWIWGMSTAPAAQNSYSLVGRGNLGPPTQAQGRGVDIGTAASPTPGSVRLQGLLMRDKRQNLVVRGASNTPMSPALAQTLVSEPVAWPYAGSPALSCIGYAQGLGADPRTAYWEQTYDGARWGQIQNAITRMSASDCPKVAAPEFGAVQTALAQEIGWLINVQSYIGSITAPFTRDGLSSYADLQTVTNDVIQAVTPPPQAKTGIGVWTIFADVLYIAEQFEVPASGMIAAAISTSQDLFASGQGGPTVDYDERITAAADAVGQELADQLSDAAANRETLIDIIAADHGRLSTVGQLGGCVPGPSCPAEWQFTQTQQNAASRMYEINAKRAIWGGVLPAAYPYVLMTNSNPGSYNGTFQGPQEQISGIGCGFAPAFALQGSDKYVELKTPTFLRYGIRQVANTPFLVFSQQNFKGATEQNTSFPPTKLLATPFGALDPGGNPDKGGLGIDEFQFMVENWPQKSGANPSAPVMTPWRGC